jgi:hypothetical protein
MMVLAGHWAQTADLLEEPFERRDPAAQILWQKLPGFLGEIEKDGARRRTPARRSRLDLGQRSLECDYWAKSPKIPA